MRPNRRERARRAERGELPRELRDVREAMPRVLLEAAIDHALDGRGNVGAALLDRVRRAVHDVRHELGHPLASKGRLRAEELVEDDAERPDVGPRVDRARRHQLLGRHVDRRAEDARVARHEFLAVAGDLRQPEVDHLEDRRARRALRQKEIRRLEVAMDDPLGVGRGHRFACFDDVTHRLVDRETSAAGDERAEVLALQVLHDDVRGAVGEHADVEDARDVLALEFCRRPRLARKARDEVRPAERARQEKLERDPPIEIEMVRHDDDAHPAGAEDPFDAVLPGNDVARLHWTEMLGHGHGTGSRKTSAAIYTNARAPAAESRLTRRAERSKRRRARPGG